MDTIYDNVYDNPQLEKLNEVLDNMTDKEFDRKLYEIQCNCYGLDPDHPESPKRIKKIKRQLKWKCHIWPTIRNTCDWWLMVYCLFMAGRNFANEEPWWAVTIPFIGGLGWFNIFLTHKFGSDYIFKN